MALTRISFNDTATDVGAYTVVINPSDLELNDSDAYTNVEILDGAGIKQTKYFDSRPITMRWKRIPKGYLNFATMLTELASYKNSEKFVNYADVDYRTTPTAWTKVRVIDLTVGISSGGGLKLDVALIMRNES